MSFRSEYLLTMLILFFAGTTLSLVGQCQPKTTGTASNYGYSGGGQGATNWQTFDANSNPGQQYTVPGNSISAYTDCNCTYHDVRGIPADSYEFENVNQSSTFHGPNGTTCEYSVRWHFYAPMQLFGNCAETDACPNKSKENLVGSEEVAVFDAYIELTA